MNKVMAALLLGLFLTGSQSKIARAASPCSPSLPEDLCELETRIFTRTDFTSTNAVREILVALKQAWIKHYREDTVLHTHLLALVSQVIGQAHAIRYPGDIVQSAAGQDNLFAIDRKLSAYEAEHGPVIPVDWDLPPSIRVVVITSERSDEPARDRTLFRLAVFVGLNGNHNVEKIRLERYPGETVIDSSTRGVPARILGPEKIPFLTLTSPPSSIPLAEGLYEIEIRTKQGEPFHGWFFFENVTPAAAPPVLAPSLNQSFATAQPTLRWVDFCSPKAQAFEHRKLTLNVRSEDATPPISWWHSELEPLAFQSLSLGKEKGSPKLTRGNYRFSLSLEERWLAGRGLFIGRKSNTTIPFHVRQ